ncbi:hypothetical protein C7212DRAFT_343081 [Tuber magnatum]|uniref:Uncharacterized protein n=1 Tax=Tuber magnatum TaxID=42249 RepID=A0A317SS27_9PEZI|nr:hypothetical protein C7212DRAFT_343081 [Tuber magnatum]
MHRWRACVFCQTFPCLPSEPESGAMAFIASPNTSESFPTPAIHKAIVNGDTPQSTMPTGAPVDHAAMPQPDPEPDPVPKHKDVATRKGPPIYELQHDHADSPELADWQPDIHGDHRELHCSYFSDQ